MSSCRAVVCPFCSDESDNDKPYVKDCTDCSGHQVLILCSGCKSFGILKKFKDSVFQVDGCKCMIKIMYCKDCQLLCDRFATCDHVDSIPRCHLCKAVDGFDLRESDHGQICYFCREQHGYKSCHAYDCSRATKSSCSLCEKPACNQHQWCKWCE